METHLSFCDHLEYDKAEKWCWEICWKYLVEIMILFLLYLTVLITITTLTGSQKMFFLLFLANIIPMVSLINCSLFQSRFFIIVNHTIPSCCSVEEYMPQIWVPSSPYQARLNTSLFFSLLIPFMPKGNQGAKNSYSTG